MSSSKDNTTLFLELAKAFLPTQFLAAKESANGRDTSWSGWIGGKLGVRDIELSKSKQTLLEEFAAKFHRITFSSSVVFVSEYPPRPLELIKNGDVHVYVNRERVLECTLRAPWGEVVTEVLQEFKTPAQIDRRFIETHHYSIKTALINKGLILEVNEALADSCAKAVLHNLILRCRTALSDEAGPIGIGKMGDDLDQLTAFVETLYKKFENARLLSVRYYEQDAFTLFRRHAGAYLLDKVWKMEKKTDSPLPKSWDLYRSAGVAKEAMLIKALEALTMALDALHPDDRDAREAAVCQAIESILLQNYIICQQNGLQIYMPLSAVVKLPLGLSFSTSALEPGKGELEQVFEAAYLLINPEKAKEFLGQYIKTVREATTGSSVANPHSSRFFPPPASTAPLGYYPQPGYAESSGYQGPRSHHQHSDHSPFTDTSRSSAYMPSHLPPVGPAYPVFPERPAFPGHVPQPMSRPPLPPKPAELAGLPLSPTPAQYALPEGVQETTPSAEPASPSFT